MVLDCKPQRIIVFGDIMLDYKNTGVIQKLANEAPIPVFLQKDESVSLGGCGNVLKNLASLDKNHLFLFSMCGDDNDSQTIEYLLDELGIEYRLEKIKGRRTTSKHRFFCSNKLLFRYDTEEQYSLDRSQEQDILLQFKMLVNTHSIDCILFSDYNKGFLTSFLCQEVIRLANDKGIFTCVDPKKDYKKYIGCSLIKPNRNEVDSIFGIHFSLDTLPDVHRKIKNLVQCNTSVITLGEEGISACFETDDYFYWKYQSKEVIDVTGAGDIVNSIIAYYFQQLQDKKFCLQLASYLATESVCHLGTYTLKFSDILKGHRYFTKNKLIDIGSLQKLDRRIVFTNGCFDILHTGHISLLQYCRSIAGNTHDVVLGLNSDVSIKRIKGDSRPICSLQERIGVLNAIDFIDWIVVFDEETPYSILSTLKPDVLVKGGDYTPDTVVGKEFCKTLLLYPFSHSISTTEISGRIKQSKQP